MDPSIEIRKVPVGAIYGLIQVLDGSDSWKKLMCHIPKDLGSTEFIPKYGTHHMNLIKNASVTQKRSCTEILFEEWGTSGQKRPTLFNLLNILTNAELYRAAEFVAVDLLKGTPPQRPSTGPAAKIETSLPRLLAEKQVNKINIESVLNNMANPLLDSDTMKTYNQNINIPSTKKIESKSLAITPVLQQKEITSNGGPSVAINVTDLSTEVSDMLKFSKSCEDNNENYDSERNLPNISILLNNTSNIGISQNISNNSSLQHLDTETNIPSTTSNTDDHSFEAVNYNFSNVSETNIPNFSVINSDVPNLSILQGSDSSSGILEYNMPHISGLQNSSSGNSSNGNVTSTMYLPHYSYEELEKVTDNFYEGDIQESNKQIRSGKIGSGGFGTVFLAHGLLDYPVAVKKLSFNGQYNGNPEEIIAENFRTEIRLLPKYQHRNILLLLGYSDDGPSKCLIYEYIDGGSLRENINNKNLTSKRRIDIALGTAKGIEYLHYAFDSPLIHQDIKSANILLTKSFTPKLCDFGLIKVLPNNSDYTSSIVGTSAYMAPEAFIGEVSVKTDVFSFGVVLQELLTGLPPIDINRREVDIISHVREICGDGTIQPLLDESAGNWPCAENFYSLSKHCLADRDRPLISDVVVKLSQMSSTV